MSEQLLLRSLDIERDAASLAEMWNESDAQWPGSWTGGVAVTAERVRQQYQEQDAIDVFVWVTSKGKIVGYCSLEKRLSEPGVAYVHLLNVHPDYQKRSLGRKFLVACIARCVDEGFMRLDLHTWPGNLKAVPLYKKTGFFWLPDTDVFMMNFMPAILQMPLAQPFFERHDWYTSFERELAQEEDDERWRGLKVFTYRWEAQGERLQVWVDREGRAVTGLETDDLFVAALPATSQPAKGVKVDLRWEVRNKGQRSSTASVLAQGTAHLKVDHRETFQVAPQERVVGQATVAVAADMPPVKERRAAPRVSSLIMVDGQLAELGTGLRPEPALHLAFDAPYARITPGMATTLNLQVRNKLEDPVTARVDLIPPPGLEIAPRQLEVDLAPEHVTGLPLTINASASGTYPIQTAVRFETQGNVVEATLDTLPVLSAYPGQVAVYEGLKGLRVDTDGVSYQIARQGGKLSFYTMPDGRSLGELAGEYGPPYDPSAFSHTEAELFWRREGGQVVVTSEQESTRFPGLTLVREIHFRGGPLVQVRYRTRNHSDEMHRPAFMPTLRWSWQSERDVIVPLKSGLVKENSHLYPVGDRDVPREMAAYAERWVAMESKEGTVGLIWNEGYDQVRLHWRLGLRRPAFACPPHAWAESFDCWLYVGAGGWRAVQRHYAQLTGGEASPSWVEPERVRTLYLEPKVPLALGNDLAPMLKLENRRQREAQGRLTLTAPAGWMVQPNEVAFEGTDRENALETELTLKSEEMMPGAHALEATVSTRLDDRKYRLPFVVLGRSREVEVVSARAKGHAAWVLDNGRTRFTVVPDFAASVVGWEVDGRDQLHTDFPKATAHSWMSPWYGGLRPIAWSDDMGYPGKLHDERWEAAPVIREDGQGITWHGVELTARLAQKQLRDLGLKVAYLTVGDSDMLKIVSRWQNDTGAVRQLYAGLSSFWMLDGDNSQDVLRAASWESKRSNLVDAWIRAGYWGTITNPATGRTVIAVSTRPDVVLADEGFSSHSLDVVDQYDIAPHGTVVRVVYLVMADDYSRANAYACLKDAE